MRFSTLCLSTLLLLLPCVRSSSASHMPHVVLGNAARPFTFMPAIGLGTGGYGVQVNAYGAYPECLDEAHPQQLHGPPPPGCGNNTHRAVLTWLRDVGGRRLDCANSYYNHKSVGAAIRDSGVSRHEIFVLSKVGPTFPLGYHDTLQQFDELLRDLSLDYVDALLVHWPAVHPGGASVGQSSDAACNSSSTQYNETQCRLSTWNAMVTIFHSGRARSIGVSNYNITHLQEIVDAELPLPSINQCPFNAYRGASQMQTLDFCRRHGITFMAYSPLGVPDVHQFPAAAAGSSLAPTLLQDATVLRIALNYNASAAQVLLAWVWGHRVPAAVRSCNTAHMQDNAASPLIELSADDSLALLQLQQDYCSTDPTWYECAPDANERLRLLRSRSTAASTASTPA